MSDATCLRLISNLSYNYSRYGSSRFMETNPFPFVIWRTLALLKGCTGHQIQFFRDASEEARFIRAEILAGDGSIPAVASNDSRIIAQSQRLTGSINRISHFESLDKESA